MKPTIRIIPCLDISEGRVVKGVNFRNLVDAGDPVELAKRYYDEGADELTLLDVSASKEDRRAMLDVVTKVAENVFIPLTVGGGVKGVSDIQMLLDSGADKVSVSSSAVANPSLIQEISSRFGSQLLVMSLDVKRSPDFESGFTLTTHGGSRESGIDALEFVETAQQSGAGELLVNSMDLDGTKKGFDLELLEKILDISRIPVVASGGAGGVRDFQAAAKLGVDALLAASVFHTGAITIAAVKQFLTVSSFSIRKAAVR